MKNARKGLKLKALKLILLFGFVSLLGDIVYEGARSINGQYLQTLGASAAIVGTVAGLGEFLGYGLRLFTGYFSDKTRAYWFFTILGYGLLISIPLLALTGVWQVAAFLIVIERIGKAVRNPARDTIMSKSAKAVGTGWGFAVHEFLDQIGALLGPILIAASLGLGSKDVHAYQQAYSMLWLPFIFLVAILLTAYIMYKDEKFERKTKRERGEKLSAAFWYYIVFIFLTTLGFVNFVILGYHFKAKTMLSDAHIPLAYAVAMLSDALFALAIGRMYDRLKIKIRNENTGIVISSAIPLLTIIIPLAIFLQNIWAVLIGMIIWGSVLGAHETIMRATIADITPVGKRGTAYGLFNISYGFAIFLGSAIIGFLYEYAFCWLAIFVIATQVFAIIALLFWLVKSQKNR